LYNTLGTHPQEQQLFAGLNVHFKPQGNAASGDGDITLLELIVPGDAPNAPVTSLLGPDGNFHTRDLFVEIREKTWTYRGRSDDWIKTEFAKFCDTKAIGDFIKHTCSDIVSELLVVGTGRPSPALLLELVDGHAGDQALKKELVERLEPFNRRRFKHEQIYIDKIIFLEKGSLPRTSTKGNIRRNAAEVQFKEEIEAAYK